MVEDKIGDTATRNERTNEALKGDMRHYYNLTEVRRLLCKKWWQAYCVAGRA